MVQTVQKLKYCMTGTPKESKYFPLKVTWNDVEQKWVKKWPKISEMESPLT